EIGEAAGLNAHAIEAILIEPVRGRLERKMRDALARDLVELAMQRDRIGRRQRAVDGVLRGDQPDGADAGRGMAQPLPDLAGESGNRGLAAGAGDGGDRCRLPRKKFRRRQRQRTARIWGQDKRHRDARWRMIAGDRDRARSDRRLDEARAIGLAAGQRKEEIAPLHRAAVDRKPGNGGRLGLRFEPCIYPGLVVEEVAKLHGVPVGWMRSKPAQPLQETQETAADTAYCVGLDAARIRRSGGGRSKRGSMSRSGAIRVITLAAVGTAFQPEVMKP